MTSNQARIRVKQVSGGDQVQTECKERVRHETFRSYVEMGLRGRKAVDR